MIDKNWCNRLHFLRADHCKVTTNERSQRCKPWQTPA